VSTLIGQKFRATALTQRIISASIFAAITLGLAFGAPAWAWALYAGIGIAICAAEWARLAQCSRRVSVLYVIAICLVIVALFTDLVWHSPAHTPRLGNAVLLAALVMWLVAVPVWLYLGWRPRNKWLLLSAGAFVLVPMWQAAVDLQASASAFVFAVGAVVVADVAAYAVGRIWGRRKLAPKISPGKTWEGVIGAFICVELLAILAQWAIDRHAQPQTWFATVLLAVLLTALSIEGDLFESWIKRMAGQKDSGRILPGHGGLLDRLDGMSASLPFAALYLSGAVY
jgi:phosphatidate cytidylyltransferase